MQQYFIEKEAKMNDLILMNENQSHHIKTVMRMKEDQLIRIVDVKQNVFLAEVKYQQANVYALLKETLIDDSSNKVKIILAQALIKKDKWDFLLQKCSELGVDEIIPFECKRCVVKSKDEKMSKKKQRWNTILMEACEQCKRSSIVELHDIVDFKALKDIQADLKIIAYEDASASSEHLKDVLKAHPNAKTICVVVGCEGGFELAEVEYLMEYGFKRVSLGNRILRAETAAMALVNTVSFYYELIS